MVRMNVVGIPEGEERLSRQEREVREGRLWRQRDIRFVLPTSMNYKSVIK